MRWTNAPLILKSVPVKEVSSPGGALITDLTLGIMATTVIILGTRQVHSLKSRSVGILGLHETVTTILVSIGTSFREGTIGQPELAILVLPGPINGRVSDVIVGSLTKATGTEPNPRTLVERRLAHRVQATTTTRSKTNTKILMKKGAGSPLFLCINYALTLCR